MLGRRQRPTLGDNACATGKALRAARGSILHTLLPQRSRVRDPNRGHVARACRRAAVLVGSVARRASDRALHAELRRAYASLQETEKQVKARRRRRRLRRLSLLVAAASVAATRPRRNRVASALKASAQKLRALTRHADASER